MDKDIVHIYNGILLSHKNNEVMPFVVTWMDLEIIMLSKVSQNKGKVLVTQSCLTLCDPMDYSLPGSPVHGISQARRVDWVPILFSGDLPDPRDQTSVACIAGRFFTIRATKGAK